MDIKKLDEHVSYGGQPGAKDVEDLAERGFRSVVNLRNEGEEDQQLTPSAEGAEAEAQGMHYAHIPFSGSDPREAAVDDFRNAMQTLPSPVYVHCHKGARAATFLMIQRAVESGESADEMEAKATAEGRKPESPGLMKFAREYVSRHFEKGD